MLASASPRRAALLRAAAFEFETRVVDIDERVRKDEACGRLRQPPRVGEVGGSDRAAEPREPERNDRTEQLVVIAADTAVVVEGEILGKPRDDGHAGAMLRLLSARRHDVMTGVSVRKGRTERNRVETTGVDCTALTEQDVAWHVASWEGGTRRAATPSKGWLRGSFLESRDRIRTSSGCPWAVSVTCSDWSLPPKL